VPRLPLVPEPGADRRCEGRGRRIHECIIVHY
jgi:hypothetical protein